MCRYQSGKTEEDIFKTVEYGMQILSDVYFIGLSHRTLPLETITFYRKIECDLQRYVCEIYVVRKREATLNKEDFPDLILM